MRIDSTVVHKRFSLYDIAVFGFIVFVLFVIMLLARRWSAPFVAEAHISLNPSALFKYTLLSMSRGFIAYFLSLVFTLVVGYAAARSRYLERVIIPALDILQSVPVLGFLPGLMIALIALFPHSEIGLNLVSIIMIFTGQVWNMTFSFYQSLKSTPNELLEAAKIYNLSRWSTFWNVEVPYAMPGLVWNSMMSMAGGWFFLTVCEAFTLGNKTYTIPGIGSYMALAISKGKVIDQLYGIAAMIGMIVFIDIFFWRPIVAWSSKFSFAAKEVQHGDSFVLKVLVNSHLVHFLRESFSPIKKKLFIRKVERIDPVVYGKSNPLADALFYTLISILVAASLYEFYLLVKGVSGSEMTLILSGDAVTALRVYASVAISILWALPVGILIGRNRHLSKRLQPIIQIAASFPAPLIYPWFVIMFPDLNYSSVLLMMLGTQWYILFNVIAGASVVPAELEEATRLFDIRGIKKVFALYIPVVFPYLVTGIITAAGGAWNASIVAEYMSVKGKIYHAFGIGALINNFTDAGRLHLLVISVVVMSLSVVVINRLIWRPLQRYAAERFKLE